MSGVPEKSKSPATSVHLGTAVDRMDEKNSETKSKEGFEPPILQCSTSDSPVPGLPLTLPENGPEPRREKRESCITCRFMLGTSLSYCIRYQGG